MTSDPQWANVQHVKCLRDGTPRAERSRCVRYEGYGPGGSALLVDCCTDDPEGTRTRLRRSFREHGGYLGAEGSVGYLFDHVGVLRYRSGPSPQWLTQAELSAGAEAVIGAERSIEVLTDPRDFDGIRAELRRGGFAPLTAEVTERAAVTAPLGGEAARHMVRLIEALTELDDVCDVYTNAELIGAPPG